jgi:AcrR family transcriptional regulator
LSEAKNRLLAAMAELCVEQGYLETTIEDVVALAGVPRAAFDRDFKDKEDCAAEAVGASLVKGLAAVGAGYSFDRSERESAVEALRALLEAFARDRTLAYLAMQGSRQMMPPSSLAHYQSGFAILTATLDRLRSEVAGGDVLPSSAARAAIGGAEAVVRREIAAGRVEDLLKLLPDIVYSATVPFLGQDEALRLARLSRGPAGR